MEVHRGKMKGVAPGMKAKTDPQVDRGGGGAKEISLGKVSAPAPAAPPTQTVPLQVTAHRASAGVDGPDLPVVAGAAGSALPDPDEPVTQQVPSRAIIGLVLSVLLLSLSDRAGWWGACSSFSASHSIRVQSLSPLQERMSLNRKSFGRGLPRMPLVLVCMRV